jgi:hypothetical protein
MVFLSHLLLLLLLINNVAAQLTLSGSPPADATNVSQYLNSFSIEFKDFPLFAGMSQ